MNSTAQGCAKSVKSAKSPAEGVLIAHNALFAQPSSYLAIARQYLPPPKSEEGAALLAPFLPLIRAAHRGKLPDLTIMQGGQSVPLSEYVCAVAAGIWYGYTLDNPLLLDWLENLRRLQEWGEATGLLVSA